MISVSAARATLPQILDQVAAGEEIVISRYGKPIAVVVRPDALRTRRAEAAFGVAAGVRDAIDAARTQPLPTRGIQPEEADRRVEELRSARDR